MASYRSIARRARKKLEKCSDPLSCNAVKLRLRAQLYNGLHELQRAEMPKEVLRTILRVGTVRNAIAVVERAIEELATFDVGQLGAKLGIGAEGPCDEFVGELAKRRKMWQSRMPPRPPGGYVCHRCDNKKCTAANHLFWGTSQDNIRDCALKSRHRKLKGRFATPAEYLAARAEKLRVRLARLKDRLSDLV